MGLAKDIVGALTMQPGGSILGDILSATMKKRKKRHEGGGDSDDSSSFGMTSSFDVPKRNGKRSNGDKGNGR